MRALLYSVSVWLAVVVTNQGEEWTVDKLSEAVSTIAQYVGWGTGAGTATKSDTTLFTEAAETRVAGTVSKQGSGSSAVYQVVATMTSLSAQTITNVGLFTASTSGTLVVKADHAGVGLQIGDQIGYTFQIDPS